MCIGCSDDNLFSTPMEKKHGLFKGEQVGDLQLLPSYCYKILITKIRYIRIGKADLFIILNIQKVGNQ